uniref:Uncharacterized protein n=1 Tax=Arundo donax TaxID=35708 RepID=A0A0A8ZIB8_ARUDO
MHLMINSPFGTTKSYGANIYSILMLCASLSIVILALFGYHKA